MPNIGINLNYLEGKPFVTVSSGPTSGSGCDFGSDTIASFTSGSPPSGSNPLTTTGGQKEADTYLASIGGGTAVLVNNQTLLITPTNGNFFITAQQIGANPSSTITGLPFITVSPIGLSTTGIINDGCDFGPDTAGTQTSGILEAIGPVSGQSLYLMPGTFKVYSPISVNPAGGSTYNGLQILGTGLQITTIQTQNNIGSNYLFELNGTFGGSTGNILNYWRLGYFTIDLNSTLATAIDFSQKETQRDARLENIVTINRSATPTNPFYNISGNEQFSGYDIYCGFTSGSTAPSLRYDLSNGSGNIYAGNYGVLAIAGQNIAMHGICFSQLLIDNFQAYGQYDILGATMNAEPSTNAVQIASGASTINTASIGCYNVHFAVNGGSSIFSNQTATATMRPLIKGGQLAQAGGAGNAYVIDYTSVGPILLDDWDPLYVILTGNIVGPSNANISFNRPVTLFTSPATGLTIPTGSVGVTQYSVPFASSVGVPIYLGQAGQFQVNAELDLTYVNGYGVDIKYQYRNFSGASTVISLLGGYQSGVSTTRGSSFFTGQVGSPKPQVNIVPSGVVGASGVVYITMTELG